MDIKSGKDMRLIGEIPLKFDTYHTQGLIKVGEYFYLTGVDVKIWPKSYKSKHGKFDRDVGVGTGYLMKFNNKGDLVSKLKVGKDSIYHPGGIDYDGKFIWVPVCEYRPFGKSLIYKIDPVSLTVIEEIVVDDAIGGVVFDRDEKSLIGYNWDSAQFYKWIKDDAKGKWNLHSIENNNHQFLHFQDGQYIGYHRMICSGLNGYRVPNQSNERLNIGGLQLIDTRSYKSLSGFPIEHTSKKGRIITGNPFCTEVIEGKIVFYFVPDDDISSLYIYELL